MPKTVNKTIKLTPEIIDKLETLRVQSSKAVGIELTPTQTLYLIINDAYKQLPKA